MAERRPQFRYPLRSRARTEADFALRSPEPAPASPHGVKPRVTLEPAPITFGVLVGALGARENSEHQFDDRHPSLSITISGRRLLLHCFAGCSYASIVAALERLNLWPVTVDQDEHPTRPDSPGFPTGLIEFDAQLRHPEKSVVERYLANRGIDVRAVNDIAYHRKAFHKPTGTWWPCMVAAVRDVDGRVRSLHRTFLSYTDPPTKAPIEKPRMLWLGATCSGCAIRLAPAGRTLVIGEGIETVASAMVQLGLPGWSAISVPGLKTIELPDLVGDVVIAADNDKPGITAAIAAAQRLRRTGRAVRIEKPASVKDFNDLLLMRRAYDR
jgi:putative DNA primase/helicase